ncbi:tyrosine-type recombinase/integrase [Streptomyces sp. NBC_00483]|uniref:tyrosine-type recombinase/integrase n=1 Tax=Streptomyces sp. NBC_00483 TaxID=2975756 RepID=UPI002E186D2E
MSFNTWLTLEERHEGDFTTITTDLLNRYFLWYLKTHSGPAATNTRQRNLHPLFLYLVEDYGHPDPYSGPFRWYSGESSTPKTLSPEFISAMLAVTGGGSAKIRDFQTVRDHAIVRVLTEGLRAEELLSLTVNSVDLPRGVVTVVPLKEARATGTGRIVPIQPPTVQAVRRYLRVRQSHKYSEVDWLWLGTRNRGHLKYNGLWRLIKRLAEQCGYDPSLCSPHGFRHSWASDLMEAGISDGDIMQAAGWKSSDMLRTYGRDVAGDRAVTAIHRLGSRY